MPLQMYQEQKSPPKPKIKNIIGIAAGKGGVGKSTITVNLALTLKQLGYSVGVLDTDIYGPSIRKMLPEDRMPTQKGELIAPALCQGIKMISMAYFRKENEAAVVRAPIANGLIKQFLNNVEWGNLDFLLIDFPPGTGDIQLTISQQAHLTCALMVTTPQDVAVMDVRKAMNMFNQVKIPVIGVVENMSYFLQQSNQEKVYIFGKGGGERLARESEIPFLGAIPLDPKICASGDQGKSMYSDENHPAVAPFKELAKNFIGHLDLLSSQHDHLQAFELVWKEVSAS